MRELTVFYCPKCGRYGYYQFVRNAVCGQCCRNMLPLSMPCSEFVKLDCAERDQRIVEEILKSGPSVIGRILAADRSHNGRHMAAELVSRIQELEEENRKLNETIEWMHQTIWELLTKSKALERRLLAMKASGIPLPDSPPLPAKDDDVPPKEPD